MKRTTILDVAKLANVSTATVSRVVSGSNLISEKTKETVMDAIKQLNYVPNSNAQNLTNNKTRIIGVVLNSKEKSVLANNFFSEIIGSISEFLINNNYYTLYINTENLEKEKEYIEFLVDSRRVDGLIFLRIYDDYKLYDYLDEKSIPFVLIGTPNKISKYLWVDNDNIKATYDITKYLISKNKKKFCFLSGPKNLTVTKYRQQGFEKALNEFNIKDKQIIHTDFSDECVKEKLSKINDIDAIITTDDMLAISAIESINNKNITVTGFNNTQIRKIGKYTFPTIDIKVKKLGELACELLLNRIDEKDMKSNYKIIETKIIEEN